jgi:hypothetical protein
MAGADFVKSTPSATFRLREAGELVAEEEAVSSRFNKALSQFRQPRTGRRRPLSGARTSVDPRQSIFIEKTKYRIDSPGELAGITKKGQQALRNKYARRVV